MGKLKKVTMDQLVAAYTELDTEIGVKPKLNTKLAQDKFEKELYSTIKDVLEPEDEFTKSTQAVFDFLIEKYDNQEDEPEADEEDDEEETPAPKKGKAAPVAAPAKGKKVAPPVEEDEDEDEDDEESAPVKKGKVKAAPAPAPALVKKGKAKPEPEPEEEDEGEPEEDENSVYNQIKEATKKADLQEIVKNEDVFSKKQKKALLDIGSVFSLKKEMLAIVGEPEGVAEAKAEKAAKAKAPKEKTPRDISASMLVREMTAVNPKVTYEEIQKELKKKGLNQSDTSVKIRMMEMLHAMTILKKLGKLK